jgi:hypothetical protein
MHTTSRAQWLRFVCFVDRITALKPLKLNPRVMREPSRLKF